MANGSQRVYPCVRVAPFRERKSRLPVEQSGEGLHIVPREPDNDGREVKAVGVQIRPVGRHELELELKTFEEKYGWASEKFVEAFRNGHIQETQEFHDWSAAYEAYRLIPSKS